MITVTKEHRIRAALFNACYLPKIGMEVTKFNQKDLAWFESALTDSEKEELGRPLWTFSGSGDGNGNGYGNGYGYGNGSGYGSGDGYGSGYGNGDGNGNGYGNGYGYGNGSGSGSGYGYGYGSGYGNGDGDGDGYGNKKFEDAIK